MKTAIKIFLLLIITMLIILSVVFSISAYVISSSGGKIISSADTEDFDDTDCILVLGAGVRADGSPSHMLEDRLLTAIKLYENGAAPKILMSGDHGTEVYDEVNTMKDFAIEKGVPSEDIFMDHAGFSTYESMYRAKDIFEAKSVIIVTQRYHLYRAIYLAESLGLEACGVPADLRSYSGQSYRDMREHIARAKDFFYAIFKPEPTYLGEAIPVSGNGNVTNDK
ncbi:MAG: SanA protein [Lachnospiraceae bacterium]|nr:SanA protein [Lachnospiraceae bacterium]